jgi:hypothetical protein
MKRLLTTAAVLGTLLGALALAPPASADPPVRSPGSSSEPFTLDAAICGFPVDVTVVANKEVATTFSSGLTIITGQLVVELSGNGKTITEQISGPGALTTDASGTTTFRTSGVGLWWFSPGQLGPGTPGLLLLTRGPMTIVFDPNGEPLRFDRTSASAIDLCAVLADP